MIGFKEIDKEMKIKDKKDKTNNNITDINKDFDKQVLKLDKIFDELNSKIFKAKSIEKAKEKITNYYFNNGNYKNKIILEKTFLTNDIFTDLLEKTDNIIDNKWIIDDVISKIYKKIINNSGDNNFFLLTTKNQNKLGELYIQIADKDGKIYEDIKRLIEQIGYSSISMIDIELTKQLTEKKYINRNEPINSKIDNINKLLGIGKFLNNKKLEDILNEEEHNEINKIIKQLFLIKQKYFNFLINDKSYQNIIINNNKEIEKTRGNRKLGQYELGKYISSYLIPYIISDIKDNNFKLINKISSNNNEFRLISLMLLKKYLVNILLYVENKNLNKGVELSIEIDYMEYMIDTLYTSNNKEEFIKGIKNKINKINQEIKTKYKLIEELLTILFKKLDTNFFSISLYTEIYDENIFELLKLYYDSGIINTESVFKLLIKEYFIINVNKIVGKENIKRLVDGMIFYKQILGNIIYIDIDDEIMLDNYFNLFENKENKAILFNSFDKNEYITLKYILFGYIVNILSERGSNRYKKISYSVILQILLYAKNNNKLTKYIEIINTILDYIPDNIKNDMIFKNNIDKQTFKEYFIKNLLNGKTNFYYNKKNNSSDNMQIDNVNKNIELIMYLLENDNVKLLNVNNNNINLYKEIITTNLSQILYNLTDIYRNNKEYEEETIINIINQIKLHINNKNKTNLMNGIIDFIDKKNYEDNEIFNDFQLKYLKKDIFNENNIEANVLSNISLSNKYKYFTSICKKLGLKETDFIVDIYKFINTDGKNGKNKNITTMDEEDIVSTYKLLSDNNILLSILRNKKLSYEDINRFKYLSKYFLSNTEMQKLSENEQIEKILGGDGYNKLFTILTEILFKNTNLLKKHLQENINKFEETIEKYNKAIIDNKGEITSYINDKNIYYSYDITIYYERIFDGYYSDYYDSFITNFLILLNHNKNNKDKSYYNQFILLLKDNKELFSKIIKYYFFYDKTIIDKVYKNESKDTLYNIEYIFIGGYSKFNITYKEFITYLENNDINNELSNYYQKYILSKNIYDIFNIYNGYLLKYTKKNISINTKVINHIKEYAIDEITNTQKILFNNKNNNE